MAELSLRLSTMLQNFAGTNASSRQTAALITTAIRSSPNLIDRFERAITAQAFKGFDLLKPGTNSGGQYSPRTGFVSIDFASVQAGDRGALDRLTFVLGHEIAHALYQAEVAKADALFAERVASMAASLGPHDYTAYVRDYLAAQRANEAAATIGGWNALRSSIDAGSTAPISEHQYLSRLFPFVDTCIVKGPNNTYSLAPGVTVAWDYSILPSAGRNLDIFGACYFDQPASETGLGTQGNSDYTNYYGARAISTIIQAELVARKYYPGDAPEVILDMQALGFSEALLESNGLYFDGDSAKFGYTDANGEWKTFDRKGGASQGSPGSSPIAYLMSIAHDTERLREISEAGDFGGAIGAAIASVLPIDNEVWRVLASATLRTIGDNLAEAISHGGISAPLPSDTMFSVLDDLPIEIREHLTGAAAGAVSAYLTAELFDALGLEGTLADLGQSMAASALTQIIQNAAAIANGATEVTLFDGISMATVYNVVGGYIGTKLASKVIDFETQEGQIGAQLGSAVGTIAGAKWGAQIGGQIGGFYGAVIGAFVGYILGGLIGDSIGTKPQAWATVSWDEQQHAFAVTNVRSRADGSKVAAASMAATVAGTLNSIVEMTGSKIVDGTQVRGGEYGHKSKDYRYWTTPAKSRKLEDIIKHGTYVALSDMVNQMAGGDVFMKRALLSSAKLTGAAVSAHTTHFSFDPTALFGDLSIAADYSRYVKDPVTTNFLITLESQSALAAQWAITLARASELNLDKRAFTDWIGGFNVYLDQSLDGRMDGASFSAGNLSLRFDPIAGKRVFDFIDADGSVLNEVQDTVNAASKDRILGTATNDSIVVSGDTLANASGLTINGTAASGSHHIRYAAVIDGGAGDDLIRGGDLGNDLVGGDGNDTLVGGKLDDWLLGGAGDDVLFAGNVANVSFATSDIAAEKVALTTQGGNGDFLSGEAGNDRLYGGTGSDWLSGGAGVDHLVGGAGGDILVSGAGNDRGANGEARIFGGAGTDQYVFGFGDGKDVVFDEADPAGIAGASGDSITSRLQGIASGQLQRNWAGGGDYEADGSVKGGEDAIAFGAGISMAHIQLRRSGVAGAPGNDLIISLVSYDENGQATATGDELTIKDWFETTRRVEWLRFADGEQIRIGDMASFIIGTGGSDVILGTYGADFLYGGAGDDVIRGLAGNDFGNGGSGNDFVAGDGDNDWVLGASGDDTVLGGGGHDTVFGDGGNDRVYGGTGSDIVVGGHGDDEVIGGAGDDIFCYSRGDGIDTVMDDYVDNWDLVWQNGSYVNGYVLQADGTVTKNGEVHFDGSKWLGQYDWNDEQQILKRHQGALNGNVAGNSGTDSLEFGIGINIQDVMLRRNGNDLELAIADENTVTGFAGMADRLAIKDWFSAGKSIENFVFAATGLHAVSGMNLNGGTDADDVLTGTAGQDWLTGNGGEDIVDGAAGDDILSGHSGSDLLKGGSGADVLFGGADDDVLDGGANADLLYGGDGFDSASYATSSTALNVYLDLIEATSNTGDANDDFYFSIEGLQGSAHNDHLGGDVGDNLLDGGAGDDALFGGTGDDAYVFGRNTGSDSIAEGLYTVDENGVETITAGEVGVDTLELDSGISLSDLVIQRIGSDLQIGVGTAAVRLVNQYLDGRAVELMQLADGLNVDLRQLKFANEGGGSGDDFIIGSPAAIADTLSGMAGNDVLSGGLGNDSLAGGDGDDMLEGGQDADVLDGGSDRVTLGLAPESGSAYGDTVRYVGSNAAVTVDLAASTATGGHASGDTLVTVGGVSTIENVVGSSGYGDTLSGDARANRLSGLDGNDLIDGRAGDDVVAGGSGNDTLYGGDGVDALAGEDGDDFVDGGAGNDLASGGGGVDVLLGGEGDDQLSGDGGNDAMDGGAGKDILGGGEGDDTLHGQADNDRLVGGEGSDQLFGEGGDDALVGEGGNDLLRGESGDDSYFFDADSDSDHILDTEGSKNRVVITGADPSRIWLTRVGADLCINVLGGTTAITIENYYAATNPSRIREIVTGSGTIYLAQAEDLIAAMAQASTSVPETMLGSVAELLATYWHTNGKAFPTVVDHSLVTNEDTPLSGSVGAVDHDDNITGYTLTGNASLGTVVLDAVTGAWTYTPGANNHGGDHFVIKVTDADGNWAEQRIDVNVRPVNDAPNDIVGPATLAMDEGTANGTVLGTFSASDVDDDTLTFQLIDNAGGRFALTPEGTLSVANAAGLDYEASASHTISVRVTDTAGAWFDKSFVATVRNVNEIPYVVTPPANTVPLIAAENTTGSTVASFVIGDPDNTTPTMVLTQNPNDWLETIGNTVRIKAGAQIDFEQLAAGGATLEDTDGDGIKEIRFTGAVRATDGTLTSPQDTSFWFLIEDVNEQPTNITLTPGTNSIAERDRPADGATRPAIVLGTLTASDPDTAGSSDFATFTYTVVDDSRFEVVGNELRLKADQWLDYEAGTTVTVRIRVTDRGGQASGLSYEKDFTFTVGNQDDHLYGSANGETLTGQANRDLIYGYGGADTLLGGTGHDDLYGGDGNDVLQGEDGDDKLWGELGDDTLQGGLGNDTLQGGDGNDALYGEAGNDALYGDAGNDSLDGGLGNDTLLGGQGDDQLLGNDGEDTLFGDGGADSFDGGAGYDTVTYEASGNGVSMDLTTGGTLNDAAGDTYIGIERVVGSTYADTLVGGSGDDVLEGGNGDDLLRGGDGNDVLDGGAGNDTLDAGPGGDQLIGGAGSDVLIGGAGSDVYLIDLNSGVDEIQNYDPNGADIDAIGYSGINRDQLWFTRSGDDLVISVIGTPVQTTVTNWYLTATAADRANYKIDFIISDSHYSDTIDAEALVDLMAGYTMPTAQADFDALHANLAFENRWRQYWDANGEPVISSVVNQTINEDGTLTLQFTVTDDITPVTGLNVLATALKPGTQTLETVLVDAPTVSGPDANGVRTVTVSTKANTSGQVQISLQATDPGGLVSERNFLLTIDARADAPTITVAKAVATTPTLDSGTLALDIQVALADQDGSETLEIRISNLPTGLNLNQGTDLGNGVWSLTPAQLAGLAIVGPSGWSQDLTGASALTVTAIAREASNGNTTQTTLPLAFVVNARPTDLAADRALAINESTATAAVASGTLVANFSRTDADNDGATYTLLNNAGGRFTLSAAGVLTVANGTLLDREAAVSHVIRVRVTDAGGLTYDEDFTITVNNVNEAPTTPTLSSQPIVLANENSALAGQVVANLVATDPDGTAPTFVITSDPRGWFTISGSQLRIAAGQSFDFEALKAAGLTVSDSDGDGRQEVVYSAVVKATDGTLDSASVRTITLRIEDANDAPHDIAADRTLTVAENAANGALVGNFTAADQDGGDGRTLSLINNAGGRFALNAAGALTVANGALLNFEGAASHTITVRVTDAGGLVRDESFTIAVTNVNEAPFAPAVTQHLHGMSEGATVAQTFVSYSASDPDGTVPSYYETLDPWDWFYISGNTLQLRGGLNLDFDGLVGYGNDWWRKVEDSDGDGQLEVAYLTAVRSTDGALDSGSNGGDGWAWFRVEDVNEGPSIGAQSFTVAESAPGAGQTVVGTVAYSDPDSQAYNRDHRFSLTGGDTARFSINATTGQLYLQGALDYEAATSHQVLVTVRDRAGTGLTSSAWLTINVGAVNERPNIQFVNTRLYKSDPESAATTFVVLSVDKVISTHVREEDTWTGGVEEYDYSSTQAISTAGALQNYADGTAAVALNASYREWYEGNWYDPRGSGAGYYTTYQETTTYVVTIVSQDASGLRSDPIRVIVDLYGKYLGPVVLDLDRNGLNLIGPAASTTQFDMDANGTVERTGWVGAGDGLLVLDRNHDGRINDGTEISFMGDKPGAASDLEGLAAYDSNRDGLLSALDTRFAEFQVWQDANQDGVSQENELASLAARGIDHIALAGVRTGARARPDENVIYANSTFGYADGSAGVAGDVFLAYQGSVASLLPSTDGGTVAPGRNVHDGGTGDAAPGRVDRTADRDTEQHDAAPRPLGSVATPEPSEQGYRQVDGNRPAEVAAEKAAAAPSPVKSTVEEYEPAGVAKRSALHDNLAISQKKRFQMIEAMATFSAEPFGQTDLGATTNDPRVLELLTALPDYRINNR